MILFNVHIQAYSSPFLGANQAVAAARLSGSGRKVRSYHFGKRGNPPFYHALQDSSDWAVQAEFVCQFGNVRCLKHKNRVVQVQSCAQDISAMWIYVGCLLNKDVG